MGTLEDNWRGYDEELFDTIREAVVVEGKRRVRVAVVKTHEMRLLIMDRGVQSPRARRTRPPAFGRPGAAFQGCCSRDL